MDSNDPKPELTGVVDSVIHLLGDVMSREAITAVVEHYNGDLNHSIDTIMNMCDDKAPEDEQSDATCITSKQNTQPENETVTVNQNVAQNFSAPSTSSAEIERPSISYSGVSQSKGAFPNQPPKSRAINKSDHDIWTLQARQIVDYHKKGSRTLILLRGVPGSGKSYLAKQLMQMMCPDAILKTHILSTDDFFMVRGKYNYDRSRLSEAHYWNQNRVREALRRGLSPVFIDNTNVEVWEMEPYVKDGVANGYIIEVLEPNTPWAKRANQLAHKNTHNVPISSIRRMLDKYQNGVSGLYLIRSFGLSYPADKVPPVMRTIPPILPPNYISQQNEPATSSLCQAEVIPIQATPQTTAAEDQQEPSVSTTLTTSSSSECAPSEKKETLSTFQDSTNKNVTHITIEELKKQLQEIEKLDQEWENGESWNENSETACSISESKPLFTPQPPRNSKVGTDQTDKFLPSASNYNDWSNIAMFMPAWNDYQDSYSQESPNVRVETASHGTSVEFGDTDVSKKNLKILIGTPKDINFYYMRLNEEKIPEKRMLDKSSMTNDLDHIATETVRCKNEEKHFAAFRKMFKSVSKVELRDIFDKCLGDVNWAVDIVLDGMENNQLQTVDIEYYSDTEDLNNEQCECLAAYNIIPNVNTRPAAMSSKTNAAVQEIAGPSTSKIKKEKAVLESSVQLKRQIEKNVIISDSHYSDHCLKIRKIRRGEVTDSKGDFVKKETKGASTAMPPNTTNIAIESTLSTEIDEDDSQTSSDDCERTVNVDLGPVFISELDEMYDRKDMTYPDNVATRVNMPVSLLNEINALWIESLMYQLEQQSQQSEYMLRQDEEFARQLALKEEQLAQAGQEPAVPDLKEIMDMELALSIYKKEITAEWRNNEPNDLAARMTREKLYNLFPEVPPEILSELLMAHDNNFQATVEVLLSSTGNAQILEQQNGVDKFIAKKEMERQKKILEEQKKVLSEVEWPLLPKEAKVDMSTVQEYRAKASQFLAQRNLYYQKAQDFFKRDMTDVATYYSHVAALHKMKFEQANSLAAASLMQVHALNSSDNATIDLHYLHVPEARESLDLFLDTHIQKLRESQSSTGPRFHNLFFITGRGLHSHNGPKIKPAVKRRLRERGIAFSERNPGLLTSKVSAEDMLTHQLP